MTSKKRQPSKRNATSWKPGQSGNPRGRPPRTADTMAHVIREDLDPREMVKEVWNLALHANSESTRLAALSLLMERGYRKPSERHEVVGVMATAQLDAQRMLSQLSVEAIRELLAVSDPERTSDEPAMLVARADPDEPS